LTTVRALRNARFRRRVFATVCALEVLGLMANAQTDRRDLEQARDEFISKIFTKCGQTYYFGPQPTNTLVCGAPNSTNSMATAREVTDCDELIEYKDLDLTPFVTVDRQGSADSVVALNPKGTLKLQLPTDPPGVERVLLLISYTSSRSRMRVASRSYLYRNGQSREWEPWGKPTPNLALPVTPIPDKNSTYVLPPTSRAFGLMTKMGGRWFFAPGPDLPLQPSLGQILGRVGTDGGPILDNFGSRGLGLAALMTPIPELMAKSGFIQEISSEKPTSCTDLFNLEPHRETSLELEKTEAAIRSEVRPTSGPAPGHLVTDTYARAVEILQKNQKNRVPDAYEQLIPLFSPNPTCSPSFLGHGVTDPGWACANTDKFFRMPGDLRVPPAFWDESGPGSYQQACKPPLSRQPWITEVQLVAEPGGAPAIVLCRSIVKLAALRKQLVNPPTAAGPQNAQVNSATAVPTGETGTAISSAPLQTTLEPPPPAALQRPVDEHTIVLTRASTGAERTATIIAPGMGLDRYNVFTIDTRDFAEGGTLEIDIQIARNSGTDGSFDLFPANVRLPTRGRPVGTLTGRYDIRHGSATRIEYRFATGQVFSFGLEGNWFSHPGATGDVRFRVQVRK
jgi:hypothetical protein